MKLDDLATWLDIQGRFLNLFDRKYDFQRLELIPNGNIELIFDGVTFIAAKNYFDDLTIDDLPYFVDAVEQDIKRF